MPRPPRFDTPGSLHHVWARGLDREIVFRDDDDREAYLSAAEDVFERSGVRCVAWCLMTNHVHFGVETSEVHLSAVFHAIHTRFAKHVNRRYRRVGPVFQGRFGSGHRQDEATEDLIAYVHLNPVGTSLAPRLADLAAYPWSGHRELLGLDASRFIDPEGVLRHFGPDADSARARMLEFLEGFLRRGDRAECAAPSAPLTITRRGQSDLRAYGVAVVHARRDELDRVWRERESKNVRRAAWFLCGGTVDRALSAVCSALRADEQAVRDGRRTRSETTARSVLAHVACDELGFTCVEVGRLTGSSPQSIGAARARGRRRVAALGLDVAALLREACESGTVPSVPCTGNQLSPLASAQAPA